MEPLPHDLSLPSRAPRSRLAQASFLIGAAGLLLAMALDVTAVIGRHLGAPLKGSIELIQACVVLAASSAIVGATLGSAHATVHVLTERAAPRVRAALSRLAALLSALFFGWLSAGSLWVAFELLPGSEATELLHVPLAPLRFFFCASALLVTALFALRALRPPPEGA